MTSTFRTISIVALVLAVSSAMPRVAQADDTRPRLVYEIVVTDPGTRNQGWHGTLYDENGNAVTVETGQNIDTRIGTFVSVACVHPWSTCGMIHTDMLTWMKTNDANAILDRKPWFYSLFVLAEGTRSEGWQGDLRHGTANVTNESKPVATPMGRFYWKDRANLWDRAGWYHESWPEGRPR